MMKQDLYPRRVDLVARFGRRSDFASMYANCFGAAPQDSADLTYRQIREEWDRFIQSPTAVTFIVEDRAYPKEDRVRGCGQMVFVSDRFVEWVQQADEPGINREAARRDRPYLLDMPQMRRANREGIGVNGLVTRWHSGTQGIFPELYRAEVRAVLYRAMMDFFLGYRYRTIIGETNGEEATQYALRAGFRLLTDLPEYYAARPGFQPKFAVVQATREKAEKDDASRISQLFLDYRPPRLHLTAAQQELLQLAMLGYEDAEIGELTGVSLDGVRKRWYTLSELERANTRIYQMLSESSPGRVSSLSEEGTVNRALWVQFVRNYREGLRPHSGILYRKHIRSAKYKLIV